MPRAGDRQLTIKALRIKLLAGQDDLALSSRTEDTLVIHRKFQGFAYAPGLQVVCLIPYWVKRSLYRLRLALRRPGPLLCMLHLAFAPGRITSQIEMLEASGADD